jgi:hypothetical protein
MRPGGQLPWLCCSRVARVQRLVKLDCDRPRSRQGPRRRPRPGGPTTAMTRTADACQQASTSARSSRRFSSTGQLSAGGSQRRAHGPVREATRKLRRPEITRLHMHRGLCRAPAPRLRQAPRFPSRRSERQHPSEWLEKAEDAPMEKNTACKHNAGRAASGIATAGHPSNAGRAECLRSVGASRRYCTVIWPTLVFTFGFSGR